MPIHIYFASLVLNTLFHNIFKVVKSAVQVVSSLEYSMRFPPAAMLTRLGLSFAGGSRKQVWPDCLIIQYVWNFIPFRDKKRISALSFSFVVALR